MKKTRAKRETTLRTETLSIRLDPKLRYLAKIAAQKQRRPISSFVEWAVEKALDSVEIGPGGQTLADNANYLWDVDECDRFVRLARTLPELLNHNEQVVWKFIKNNRSRYWRFSPDNTDQIIVEIGGEVKTDGWIDLKTLREDWPLLSAVMRGEKPESALQALNTSPNDKPALPPSWTNSGKRKPSKE